MNAGNSSQTADWRPNFPRLAELYDASDKSAEDNYFQHPNVVRALGERHSMLRSLEDDLSQMDQAAWAEFKTGCARYVSKHDRWQFSTQLFECFNEAEAYAALRREGYQNISFVPRRSNSATPDLIGWKRDEAVLVEVKTINDSDWQKTYLVDVPNDQKIAVDSVEKLTPALEEKIRRTVAKGLEQLLRFIVEAPRVRRVLYLVIRFDFNVHVSPKDVARFVTGQLPEGVELVLKIR